ncbi:MAG: hypothetical protein JSU70_08515 [Phycisphaerales bacterium]|nr:MAG: hypothetical protein JSU70_08515 [Phycisphaerales bacterium]
MKRRTMMYAPRAICIFSILALVLSAPVTAEHIKVDLDTRNDSTAAGFDSWQGSEGTYKAFGEMGISLDFLRLPSNTYWKINWYNKSGLNKYELAMDCLYANYDDGSQSHPSYNGGTILMTIEGLTEGTHTIITYHNAPWPISKYNRTICACKIYVDGVEQFTVQPSQYVTDDADVESTFFSVEATAGVPVIIKLEPVGDTSTQICTAVLSGFEIDNPAAIANYASDPTPADGDGHVFANNDDPIPGSAGTGHAELSWAPSEYAEHQDIYFGTGEADVTGATTATAGVYQGRHPGSVSTWNAANLDSKFTYYWRVDTVKPGGSITKGYIWKFRTRHLAFPTAEGYGRFAIGGRGGRVIHVTNLNDSGPGSLRAAVEAEGPRTIVFDVSGLIALRDRLILRNPYCTVAGQTAPGKGMCIRDYDFGTLGGSDFIIRYVRVRVGKEIGTDKTLGGMGMGSTDHSIMDHCSISWAQDEQFSSRSAGNITLQRTLISEALHVAGHNNYPFGKSHGFAASIGGDVASFHHNLLAHCEGRNWSLAGGLDPSSVHTGSLDIRNNVVYNWDGRTTDGGAKEVNFVRNYYKPGPASGDELDELNPQFEAPVFGPQQYYVEGNVMEGVHGPEGPLPPFEGVDPQGTQSWPVTVPEPFFEHYVTTQSAADAYDDVLADVGCNRPMLDDHDIRVINETRNGTFTYRGYITNRPGLIDNQADAGGWETYPEIHRPANFDTDGDGLPNWWEAAHHLNCNSPAGDFSDANGDINGDGYTNLEEYLNYLAAGGTQPSYSCTASIDSDLDGDCKVDLLDYAILADAWATQSASADIDGDTSVDSFDLMQLAMDWLKCNREPAAQCRP